MEMRFVFVLCFAVIVSGVDSLLVGVDSTGEQVNMQNWDFDFLFYNYTVNGTVNELQIQNECVITATPAMNTQIVYVNWANATAAGCSYFATIVSQFTTSSYVPAVLIFSSTNPLRAGTNDPYDRSGADRSSYYLSPLNPANTPIYLTLLSVQDNVVFSAFSFPLTVTITSNPSLDSLDLYSASFRAPWLLLVVLFSVMCAVGVYELVTLSIQQGRFVRNLRSNFSLAMIGYYLCRIISYSIDILSYYGRMPFWAFQFLWFFGFFFALLAVAAIMLEWIKIAAREIGYTSWYLLLIPRLIVGGSLVFILIVTVFFSAGTRVTSISSGGLIVFVILAIILLLECALFIGAGIKILMRLRAMQNVTHTKSTIFRITLLMMSTAIALLVCIAVLAANSLSGFHDATNQYDLLSISPNYLTVDYFVFAAAVCVFSAFWAKAIPSKVNTAKSTTGVTSERSASSDFLKSQSTDKTNVGVGDTEIASDENVDMNQISSA